MKALFCLFLIVGATLHADEAAERAAIDKLIDQLNDPGPRAELFIRYADCPVDFDHLIELHLKPAAGGIGMNETWSILTKPRVVTATIRFVKADLATVDGASLVEGAMTLVQRVPLLFLVKKEGGKWRIATVRVLDAALPHRRSNEDRRQ